MRRTDIILLGGPGLAKKEFLSSLDPELAKKTSLVENITFSTSPSDITKKSLAACINTGEIMPFP